jgi:hypothetical protein
MEVIPFSKLDDEYCALVDAGSVLNFLDEKAIGYLRGASAEDCGYLDLARTLKSRVTSTSQVIARVRREILKRQDMQKALILLERIVLYDYLVFDQRSLESGMLQGALEYRLQNPQPERLLEDLPFKATEIPLEVYQEAHDLISSPEMRGAIETIKKVPYSQTGRDYHGGDERFHDLLFASGLGGKCAFAETSETVERALFYLEVSKHTLAPVVTSPEKSEFLATLKAKITQEVHTKITEIFSEPWRERITKEFGESCAPLAMQFPPVVEMIIRDAIEKEKPFLDCALDLRQSEPAKEYRKYLSYLHRDFRDGDARTLNDYGERLATLRDIAKQWASSKNVRLGVSQRHLLPDLSAIPYLGDIAKLLGLDKVAQITVPWNWNRPYLAFLSSYYSHVYSP